MDMESRAEMVRGVPLTLFSTSGTLRLGDGRLSFVRSRNRVVFDVPVRELHSVAVSAMGLTVWHGERRYRFAIGDRHATVHPSGPISTAVAISQLPGVLDDYRKGRDLAHAWCDTLTPLVGPAPSSVSVRAPWPLWAWIVSVVAATLVLIGAIVGIVLATA